jgi:5-carboxymethyl-2-hydroxymuconate isomerase
MPHFIVEYTSNIKAEARIPLLLAKANEILIAQGGLFPTGGIRSRAIEIHDYCIADGQADYAFVHCNLKIGAGRTAGAKKQVCDQLFNAIKDHFAELFSKRYLALSLELNEFSESGAYKHNNIHARFKTDA